MQYKQNSGDMTERMLTELHGKLVSQTKGSTPYRVPDRSVSLLGKPQQQASSSFHAIETDKTKIKTPGKMV